MTLYMGVEHGAPRRDQGFRGAGGRLRRGSSGPSRSIGRRRPQRADARDLRLREGRRHSDSSVIITGESGTGKEVIANLLHHSSRRRHQPFVAVSCALFSENADRDASCSATSAAPSPARSRTSPGRFEMAQGGTLFLDDIDDVPLSMQVKLLRALQNRHGRAGRRHADDPRQRPRHHRHQARSQADGRRRQVPRGPLLPAERAADRAAAAARAARGHPAADRLLPQAVLRRARHRDAAAVSRRRVPHAFMRYRWPGNVRELENACERIVQTCTCGTVRIGCVAGQRAVPPRHRRAAAAA